MPIVYSKTKAEFWDDIMTNDIEWIISRQIQEQLHRRTAPAELWAFKNSLLYMNNVLQDQDIPSDAWITIEYQIPLTAKRVDFIITWKNKEGKEQVIIIELKQRSKAELTDKDAIVATMFKWGRQETNHPSYQAWSYAALLYGFNETVYNEGIVLKPCAYLHNYEEDWILDNHFYQSHITKAPLFFKSDALKLREFIKQFVRYGDTTKTMFRIEQGKIKPSKQLTDSVASMLQGNEEFIMIDDQKVVYENIMHATQQAHKDKKHHVVIVQWWPGTWKTVVAINCLVAAMKSWMIGQYVTKNAAPREVFERKLTQVMRKTEISNLFVWSWAFTKTRNKTFDILLVDEAHRLNEKSGMFKNLGENQIKELVNAAHCSVFFVDEDQKVTLADIGSKEEIQKRASHHGAIVHEFELSSQFRCNGSDGYLAWLDNVLEISETANYTLDKKGYDFQVVDSPTKLRDIIFEKNKINNKARIVAWYCRDRISKKSVNNFDITFPEHDFAMRWNLATDANLWIINPRSINEIGCIHTCQWLEVDYIWVIVWDDLVVRDGKVITNPFKRARTDASLKWYKKMMETDPEWTLKIVDKIIKNTYRTLMTRGAKGCYVYFVDKETEEYFRSSSIMDTKE